MAKEKKKQYSIHVPALKALLRSGNIRPHV